jgi:hypothetical protein
LIFAYVYLLIHCHGFARLTIFYSLSRLCNADDLLLAVAALQGRFDPGLVGIGKMSPKMEKEPSPVLADDQTGNFLLVCLAVA